MRKLITPEKKAHFKEVAGQLAFAARIIAADYLRPRQLRPRLVSMVHTDTLRHSVYMGAEGVLVRSEIWDGTLATGTQVDPLMTLESMGIDVSDVSANTGGEDLGAVVVWRNEAVDLELAADAFGSQLGVGEELAVGLAEELEEYGCMVLYEGRNDMCHQIADALARGGLDAKAV